MCPPQDTNILLNNFRSISFFFRYTSNLNWIVISNACEVLGAAMKDMNVWFKIKIWNWSNLTAYMHFAYNERVRIKRDEETADHPKFTLQKMQAEMTICQLSRRYIVKLLLQRSLRPFCMLKTDGMQSRQEIIIIAKVTTHPWNLGICHWEANRRYGSSSPIQASGKSHGISPKGLQIVRYLLKCLLSSVIFHTHLLKRNIHMPISLKRL